jgi:hypothetical protein
VADRLRAKPPTTAADSWRSGTLVAVRDVENGKRATIEPGESGDSSAEGDAVAVTVTDAVFELFAGRVEDGDPVGETVWFK